MWIALHDVESGTLGLHLPSSVAFTDAAGAFAVTVPSATAYQTRVVIDFAQPTSRNTTLSWQAPQPTGALDTDVAVP